MSCQFLPQKLGIVKKKKEVLLNLLSNLSVTLALCRLSLGPPVASFPAMLTSVQH